MVPGLNPLLVKVCCIKSPESLEKPVISVDAEVAVQVNVELATEDWRAIFVWNC